MVLKKIIVVAAFALAGFLISYIGKCAGGGAVS